ncbi:hypothetical protein E1B28_002269 [Marasmius oreades]|uniref:Protein kinase domain-containing protein n=1 Tax=Marasmius oreades TaxID=181124 RepID=A0A9P7RNB4_9AGAR|nr:uncharacterized protein E1B28_002269 [Marasmius oreades]KAG7086305.1 hypothetical protein E1B28_002269 [Marasmius oreades]
MLHSFVAARLLPRPPAWATYAQRVAPSLATTPFLALHIQANGAETQFTIGQGRPNLFVISHEKPDNEYLILNHPSQTNTDPARTLTVVPPLPFQHPLYLSIMPRINAGFLSSQTYKRLVKVEQYQLDQPSIERLLNALKEAGHSIPGVRKTGNGGEAPPGWDSWSGDSPREQPRIFVLPRYVPLSFDLVPFKALPAPLDTSVFMQIALFRQFYLDYTWEGCRLVIQYIESMRKALPRLSSSGKIFRAPALTTGRDPDPPINTVRPSLAHLASLPIPHDGDPQVCEEDELADDWKDEEDLPVLEMEMAPVVSCVEAGKIKVIALDCDAILVNGPLQEALITIFPSAVYQEGANGLDSPRAIVQKIARYLGATEPQSVSQDVLAHLSKPSLHVDALTSISTLVQNGYSVLALPGAKNRDIVSQVPVVTPNLHGVAEPAALAGFPTTFIKRHGSRSAKLTIPTVVPTYTVAGMEHILPLLLEPTYTPPAQKPEVLQNFLPLRIRGCYQVTFTLGTGSYGCVWNAIQLSTGAGVAIKVEVNKSSTLSYEAAIYAQLEGVKGIPVVHWAGLENTAQVLVMDKLGPTLEKFRRVCRGAMSLKTVLMLGEQMLTTIEEVHSRGVIVRDINPDNFAMGLLEDYKRLYLFDMGLCKLFLDPTTGKQGRTRSRRDDIEAIGNLLLYLLHGQLPWQGIYAPDIPSKLRHIGEMKRGRPFTDLLSNSPPVFTPFFEHCRSLAFEDKPDYAYLRCVLRQTMEEKGWEYDWEYDWWSPGERGTLLPEEYKFEERFLEPVRRYQNVL